MWNVNDDVILTTTMHFILPFCQIKQVFHFMCNSVKEKSSNSTHLKINERKVQITCVYKCKFYFIFAFYDYSLRVMI